MWARPPQSANLVLGISGMTPCQYYSKNHIGNSWITLHFSPNTFSLRLHALMIFTHYFFFALAKQRQFRRYEIHVQRQRQCNAEVFSLGRRLTFSSPSFIPSILFLIFFFCCLSISNFRSILTVVPDFYAEGARQSFNIYIISIYFISIQR